MSKRYSDRRSSRRRTRQSFQSEISGVLDSDSNVDIDDEGNPLWFRELENNSVSIRPSKRFSAIQNEVTTLDSNSEPDLTPLRKSWWKDLDNTPDILPHKRVQSTAARNKSHVSKNHVPDSDISNVSSIDESLIKQKSRLRHNKRESLQKNVFSDVLESSKVSISSEKGDRSTQDRDKQDTSVSPSTSDTSKSIEKVRKLPFKKRRQVTPIGVSENLNENPENNLPNVFENVLEESHSISSSPHENIVAHHSNLSINSAETLKLKRPSSQNRNELQNNSSTDVSSRVLESPQVKSPRKKRTIFTATRKRKIPNFSELLTDESEDEQLGDQSSNEDVVKSNQKETITDISSRVSESPKVKSPRKKRTTFTATRKRKTPNFSELLNDKSEDEQLGDQSSNEGVVKSIQKETITDISSRTSKSPQAKSPRKKHTIFTATRKRKTLNFSELLNDESEDEQLSDRSSNKGVVKSNQNEVITESGTQPSQIIGSQSNILAPQRDLHSEDSIEKSRGTFLRKKRKSNQEQMFAQALESSSSPVYSETPEGEKIDTRTRSRYESEKSDFERQSMTRNYDEDTPVRPSPRLPIHQSRSKSNAGPEEFASQSHAASNRNSLYDHEIREERSNIRLMITSDEEEDREDITRDEVISESSVSLTKVVTRSSSKLPELQEISGNDEFQPSVNTSWKDKQNVGEVSKSLPKINGDTTRKSKGLFSSNKNKSSSERNFGATSAAQDVIEKNTGSDSHNERESTQHLDLSQRAQLSTQTDPEKAARLKGALEQLKKKFGLPQNSGIESYFIKTAKPRAAVTNSEKLASQKNPIRNQRKTPLVEPNKAYIVDGKVYKRPKLPRPKLWATNHLYKFLWKQMEPKYKLKARIRSEKFITLLSDVVSLVIRRKKYENYKENVQDLIKEMAHLGIIKTRNDFYKFCQDFLPYDFRIKVVPMVLPGNIRNVPFHPEELHTPIL
ncbi:uncharacterized protein LOC107225598 isoform X1 [Neodiprion lecontei]|uniref:Uncharacterized protein LOC107225598 isoform X1 n=1 Tax=Neodiprion lecontei TaxID=441921 RepID=A0A6J0C4X7_NEOLC|nr:uncharacterized protein LOC107225598 isoform X1 [Neodiprion lecontei]